MPDKFDPFGKKIAIKAPPPAKIQGSVAHSKHKDSVPEPAPAPAPSPALVPESLPVSVTLPELKFTCPTCGTKLDACPVCKH